MQKTMRSFVPLVIFLAGCLFGTCCAEAVPDSRPFAGVVISYQDIRSVDITGTILKEDKSLREWADELERTEPKTPRDVMTTYLVCLRTGRDETVCKMIPLLFNMFSTLPPEVRNRPTLIEYVFAPLKDLPRERRHVITMFFETFDTIYCPVDLPQTIRDAEWLRQRWQNACDWEPDEWARNNPYLHWGMGRVPTTLPPTALQWQRHYLTQLQLTGKEQAELERLNNEAKESPHDARKMPLLINGLYIRYRFSDIIQQNLDWFIPTAEKCPAYEAWSIAQFFEDRKSPNTQKIREVFLDRALAVTLTAAECDRYSNYLKSMSSMVQPERSDELIRAMFRIGVMDGLNKLYLDTNRNDEAQKIMLEARELRKKHDLSDFDFLAGMTQAASGQRVVEREILEREVEDETNPAYWVKRADYYRGRKEPQEEEKALRKALELFITPEARRRGGRTNYQNVRSDLFRLLVAEKRFQEAVTFFREQRHLVRNEPESLRTLYNDHSLYDYPSQTFRKEVQEIGFQDEYDRMLKEDVEAALAWLKENTEPPQDSVAINDQYSRWNFVTRLYNLVVQERLIDFENDPFTWEYLNQMSAYHGDKIIPLLLFPPDGKGAINETMFQAFEKAMLEETISPRSLSRVGAALYGAGVKSEHYAKAMPFWEASYKRGKPNEYQRGMVERLATYALETGDWRKGEAYTVESYFLHGNPDLQGNFRRAAELAEKAGETKEAQRIRQRIANLEY